MVAGRRFRPQSARSGVTARWSALAVVAIGVAAAGCGAGGADEPVVSLKRIELADTEAQSIARTAQTALESYATAHDGSYTGATPEELATTDAALLAEAVQSGRISIGPAATSYQLTVESDVGGNRFSIARDASGVVTLSCVEAGNGLCSSDGAWGR